METGLNVNEFSQYLSERPLNHDQIADAQVEESVDFFISTFNELDENFMDRISITLQATAESNPERSQEELKFFAETRIDATSQISQTNQLKAHVL